MACYLSEAELARAWFLHYSLAGSGRNGAFLEGHPEAAYLRKRMLVGNEPEIASDDGSVRL